MATIQRFEDLQVWEKARAFSKSVFDLSQKGLFVKDFELKGQINRSAGSIMDNIAEGFDRSGKAEFINFLTISKGSCAETRSQLYRAYDRNYIDEGVLQKYLSQGEEIGKMLSAFITYLNKTNIGGVKFKDRIKASQSPTSNLKL